jgi:WD40 repeat protein
MFSPGESVALFLGEEQLRLVDTATGNPLGGPIALEALRDDEDDVYGFAFSEDDRWLIAGRSGRTFALHRVGPTPGGPSPISPFRSGQFSPDGKWVLVQQPDGVDAMWNLTSLSRLFTAPRPMYWASRFSPDSRWFVRRNAEGRAEMWDLHARSTQAEPLRPDPVSDIQTSPDGRWLVTLGDLTASGRHIDVWQLEGAAPAHAFPADGVRDLEFTSNGRWLLARDARDDTTIIWDLANRTSERFKASLDSPHDLSSDGRLFAIAELSTITLADPATGDVLFRLEGHSKRLSDVAFSPDGRTLASVDADGSLILWDLTSRRRLGDALIGPGEGEESRYRVGFAPHGLTLGDGIPAHPVTWIEDICRRIDPAIPSGEWQRLVGSGNYPQACDAIEAVTSAGLSR